MKLEWKDISSYSKGDTKKVPTVLKSDLNEIEIKIHRHIYYENTWLLSSTDLRMDKINLYTDNFEEAEIKAINCILNRLSHYVETYEYLKSI